MLLLALAVLPSCAVYDSSLLDTRAGVTDPNGGDDTPDAVGGASGSGQANPGEGGKGSSPSTNGGMSAVGGTGSGTNGGAVNGGSAGRASNGGSSSGGTPGTAGSGATGNTGTGGTGAGGMAAGGTASGGTAAGGAPAGGSAGTGGTPINPCDRANWKATASESSTSPKTTPSMAIDGSTSTRWASGAVQVGGEWFLLDLGAVPAHLTQISLEASAFPGDEPLKYKLETSTDGKTFFLLCSGIGAPETVIKFADTQARYLRITQTGSDPDANWWSIQELTLTCSI